MPKIHLEASHASLRRDRLRALVHGHVPPVVKCSLPAVATRAASEWAARVARSSAWARVLRVLLLILVLHMLLVLRNVLVQKHRLLQVHCGCCCVLHFWLSSCALSWLCWCWCCRCSSQWCS